MPGSTWILLGLLLAGGPTHGQPAPPKPGDLELTLIFDERGDRRLEGVQFAPRESTPPQTGYSLFEVVGGSRTFLARRVGAAAYTPDGAILFVQRDALFELKDGRTRALAQPVSPDFACNAGCTLIAVVRPAEAPSTSIDLVPRAGGPARRLVEAESWNGLPIFSPDGRSLFFHSSRSGLASLFRVGLDGQGLRQLTNVGLLDPDDEGMVPPAEYRRGLRFDRSGSLLWPAAGALWSFDLATGTARSQELAR